ncbi:hypothetical protein T05_10760 [Trichinella murrelli]|uniref:Uncharacterized protein n=1 Tax=Trichinella murrelli TaxID=144512 RepID=A0A0V0SSR0_9BILA|nr:hypothetical protein T05_10760 [Trichinella murrelli]
MTLTKSTYLTIQKMNLIQQVSWKLSKKLGWRSLKLPSCPEKKRELCLGGKTQKIWTGYF